VLAGATPQEIAVVHGAAARQAGQINRQRPAAGAEVPLASSAGTGFGHLHGLRGRERFAAWTFTGTFPTPVARGCDSTFGFSAGTPPAGPGPYEVVVWDSPVSIARPLTVAAP
jgi:hypothetical protein